VNAVETPPPGLGPVVAVSRVPAAERRKAIIGTLIAYAAIGLGFTFVRGFWWPAIPIMAVFAGLTILVVQRSGLAAGDGWLKVAGSGWVETARLTAVHLRKASTANFIELEDVAGRKVDVRLGELARTPQVWSAFYAGLSRSLDNGLVMDESTGAHIRATNAGIVERFAVGISSDSDVR
jgi:hypothetical protein